LGRIIAVDDYTCGLTSEGTPHCWGRAPTRFQEIPEGETFTQLAGGAEFLCGLRPDRTIGCWGRCLSGICNAPAHADFTQVAAGRGHACGLRDTGAVECWGTNGAGQTDVVNGTYAQISLGYYHSCAVGRDDALTCWGRDNEGQWAPLNGPDFATGFGAVAAGGNYTCGIRTSGQPVCFGLGEADWAVFGVETPGLALSVAAGSTNACLIRPDYTAYCTRDAFDLSGVAVTALAVGQAHVCGLTLDGAVQCWGSDAAGQSAVPAFAATAPPVCGNGRIDAAGGEACDDRNEVDGDGCDNDCQVSAP
jgi:cysteine-rich repeat protein